MLKKIVSLVVFATGFLTAMPQLQANDRPTITIGLIDTFSPTFYIKTYAPTLEHLKALRHENEVWSKYLRLVLGE